MRSKRPSPNEPQPTTPPAVPEERVLAALDEVFGFRQFRPDQREIVGAILDGRDVFAVMPTGGGKSLCYQLPAYLMEGTALVVSPLISLMKDQVDAAKANGLRAEFLNSSLGPDEAGRITRLFCQGQLHLLYLAPERLAMDQFLPVLKSTPLSLIAIDEAHCISEWGHDFRKDYLTLGRLVSEFPDVPVAAFTATATHRVGQDIIEKLGLRDPFKIRASFDRPNLFYQVIAKENAEEQILDLVRARAGESGIVYRTTRKDVEATAGFLQSHRIKAVAYHAGLDNEIRRLHQDMFNRDEVNVVVATIAFGMGIDKSNVRYVIHGDLPKNIEGYYQETGRSGRDGDPAHCVLVFGYGDVSKIRFFINQMEDPAQREIQRQKLTQMADYAGLEMCRRRQILGYFDEKYARSNCGACDVCVPNAQKIDQTRDAQIIMSAVARTEEQCDAKHVIEIVLGTASEAVCQRGHDQLKTFGAGRDRDAEGWGAIIDDLLAHGCLAGEREEGVALKLTAKGRDVLFGRRRFAYIVSSEPEASEGGLGGSAAVERKDYEEDLFEELRSVRKRLAREKSVPPFVVFSDRTLHELARIKPTTMAQMREVSGVGKQKLREYGPDMIEAIARFGQERPARQSPPRKATPKGRTSKGDSLQATWLLVQKGLTLPEIGALRDMTQSTIVGHIEELIVKGYDVNLLPYVTRSQRQLLDSLFAQHGLKSLGPVVEAGEGQVDYGQARLVRAALKAKTK